MPSISTVVDVTLLTEQAAAAPDNPNVVAIMTSQQDGPLSTANRAQVYYDLASVASDFGTASAAYQHASTLFGSTPNPVSAGGALVMAYWRGASETVAATAGYLTGAQLTEVTVVSAAQAISDGTFDVNVDAGTVNVTGLDLRTATSLADIATLVEAKVTGTTVAVSDDNRLVITSDTTGAASLVSLATDPGSGTYVGDLLGLSGGSGAVATAGAASDVLTAETQVAALTALKALHNVKGVSIIDAVDDTNRKLNAAWAQANDTLIYEVFSTAANLVVDVTNAVWDIKLSGYTNYRMIHSLAGNRKLATAYMARMHTVNFSAENSALTMEHKTLNATAETYTDAQLAAAQAVGLDIYTTIKNTGGVRCSGANDFTDNRYNLIAFVDAVQTDLYNVLHGTAIKVPQTETGVAALVDAGERVTERYRRAGVFAPGTWTSSDRFGDADVFDRSIETKGYYWLAGRLADQSVADRQARKSPVLQAAVKNAGAIHSADVIINFNY